MSNYMTTGWMLGSEFKVDPNLSPLPPGGSGSGGFGTAGTIGVASSVVGALTSMIGAFSSAQSAKSNLEFQAAMSAINARMAERTAQSILRAGEQQIGKVTMRAGQVKSSQKAHQGSRGITMGVGSAAEETASTDLIKEMDINTIYVNSVNASNAARMQSVNYSNASLIQGTSADSINPWMAAGSSLLTGAGTVASSWTRNKRLGYLADSMGIN